MGVIGMNLLDEDEVVGMQICTQGDYLLVVSENGMGKRTPMAEFTVQLRGGKGVKTINVTDKTGRLVDIKDVDDTKDLVIINKSGITIRLKVADVRVMGRATQGVRLINLEKRNDEIASVCVVDTCGDEEVVDENNTEGQNQELSTDVVDNNIE